DADQRQQESIRPEADDNCRKQKGLDKRVAGAATRQVIRIGRNLPVERAYRQEQQIDRCKQNVGPIADLIRSRRSNWKTPRPNMTPVAMANSTFTAFRPPVGGQSSP